MNSLREALLLFRDQIWRPQWKMVLVFLAVSMALCILPLHETIRDSIGPKDYGTWWKVAHAVREGTALYQDGPEKSPYNFFYPPAIATLFYAPLSFGGPFVMVVLLCLLSCLGYLLSLVLSVYLATGQVGGQPRILYIMPWLIGIPFAWDIYFLGQLNMTLLAIMLLGFVALEKKKFMLAGGLFALPAAAKAFPLTVIFYLIWRKYYVSAASMIAALFVILVLLPAPVRGFDRNFHELKIWCDRMLFHNSGDVLADQPDRAYRFGNQTLISVVNRLTRPLPVGKESDKNMTVNVINISPSAAFDLAAVIAGVICIAFVAAMPAKSLETPSIRAIEGSIVLILIVVFSPKAGSFYYCWIIPGFTVALAEALKFPKGSPERRWITIGITASILVLATALTQSFSRVAQGMGATMWGAVVLCLVLIGILWNRKRTMKRAPAEITASR